MRMHISGPKMHCQGSIDISAAGRNATERIGADTGDYMNHAIDDTMLGGGAAD